VDDEESPIPFLGEPKGRINEHTQMRGANDGKTCAPRPFQQLAAPIAAMMH